LKRRCLYKITGETPEVFCIDSVQQEVVVADITQY
jgi:hypothetical protein